MNHEHHAPQQADQSPAAPAPAHDYQAPAVSPAAQAAEFVARIFADMGAPEEAAPAAPVPEAGPPQAPQQVEPDAIQGAEAAPQLAGQRVLILGLGASGMAMARWCARRGAEVTVADTREQPPQLAALRAELPQVRFCAGPFDAALVEGQGMDAVYRSPGLRPVEIAPVVIAADAHQISVGGELDLFAMALRELHASQDYAPAVLAITGTNGKTTVTSLTGLLVQGAGKRVAVAGN
ncbi:MAG: UDP-N-acetylmuramoyl-L-alanine--D-glutamate ligase, partial [Proteobacteria bacterium]|nr:UDP-N-acetylmuramoyl-L-alanine--D-glutamate ligase [Pseudomonadota bacterium]